jgi:hypothetical protein
MRGLVLAFAACLAPLAHGQPGVERAAEIGRLGAPTLAERYLDLHHPPLASAPAQWHAFEAARIERLLGRQAWREILDRRAGYPESLPPGLHALAAAAAAEAHVALGDPTSATLLLDGLLDSSLGGSFGTASDRARWAALRVRAWLAAGEPEGARKALSRYRTIAPDDLAGRAPLEARLLLLDGHLEEVLLVLEGVEGNEAAYLRLAAVAEAGTADPTAFLRAARPLLDGSGTSAGERRQAWSLVARVAGSREPEIAAMALEQALGIPGESGSRSDPGGADVDMLWAAYDALALRAANQAQLLVGRFQDWLALARERVQGEPVVARAMLAHLVLAADDPVVREVAGAALAALVGADPVLRRSVALLWTGSGRVAELDAIPESVRPVLVIEMVAQRRFEAASAFLPASLPTVGSGDAQPTWLVPYAQALIRAGLAGQGVEVLVRALAPGAVPPPETWPALVGSIGDLLGGGDAELAGQLLDAAAGTELDDSHRAALAFLRAEVSAVAGAHERAALQFLEAAGMLRGPDAVLARVLAARAAARAGLRGDAQGVLERLAIDVPEQRLPALLEGTAGR